MSPSVSVVTPTYQRVDTLPRLYESLLGQDFGDFEWVVVDDGSSDGTEEVVQGWAREAPFHIEYRRQANQGKHAAFNRCVERARGEFCSLIDSDDWFTPDALGGMLECWNSIPSARRERFANVEGLRVGLDGELVGDRFPVDVFDSDTFEMEALYGIRGDTIGMYRTEILRAHPFPESLGWHVAPSLVWNRIAARYKTRFVNRVWSHTGYYEGGLSTRVTELRLRFPEAQLLYWTEFAAMPRRMRRRVRLRANVNSARYSLHVGAGVGQWLRQPPRRGWKLAATPIGALLYLGDRVRSQTPAEES